MRSICLWLGVTVLGCGVAAEGDSGSPFAPPSSGDSDGAVLETQTTGSYERKAASGKKEGKDDKDDKDDGGEGKKPGKGQKGWFSYNDGLVGGNISDALYDTRTPGVAWATSGTFLYRSLDHGVTWAVRSQSPAVLRSLALPSGDADVLLAATDSGVFSSSDAGVTWKPLALQGLAISAIAVHPKEPLRVYVGVNGAGILRSDDGGKSFFPVNYEFPYANIHGLATNPNNPDELLVAPALLDSNGESGEGEVLRSVDGGDTWSVVYPNATTVRSVAICEKDPSIAYAGTDKGVLKSLDGGASWEPISLTNERIMEVQVVTTDCNRLYSVAWGSGTRRSFDGGVTWEGPLTSGIPFYNKFPFGISIDPASPERLLGAGQGGLFFTDNGGDSFTVVGGYMGLHAGDLQSSPAAPSELWMASWGSMMWHRKSASDLWERSTLMVDYTFTAQPDPVVKNRVFAGTWSYGFVAADNATFTQTLSDDANPRSFAFDPAAKDTVYAATQIRGVYKSTNGGKTWAPANVGLAAWPTADGQFIDARRLVVDGNDSSTLYLGTNGRGLFKSTNAAGSWSPIAPAFGTDVISCLVQAAGKPSRLYACVTGKGLWSSADGGLTWAQTGKGLPFLSVNRLLFDAATGVLYATGSTGVYKSTDGVSFAPFDLASMPEGGVGALAIIAASKGSKSRLMVVSAPSGLLAHKL